MLTMPSRRRVPTAPQTAPGPVPAGRGWRRAAILGAGVAALAALGAAQAQELRGPRLTIDIDNRLETGRNLGLAIPSEGGATRASTGVELRLSSETPIQRFSLDTGLRYTVRRGADPDGSGFSDPRLRFSFQRDGVDSLFSLSANVRRSQVDFLRDLLDFVDEDGILVLPEDFNDLTGVGRRLDYSAEARLELGREAAPAGISLVAAASGIDYTDAAANLNDTRRFRLGATGRLRLSPVATATLSLNHNRFRTDDLAATDRRTNSLSTGISYELDPITTLGAGIGYSRIETREFGIERRSEGLTGDLSFGRTLPDGDLSARLGVSRVEAGQRVDVTVGRGFERPGARFSGSIGLTRGPGGDTDVIGALGWARELPNGTVSANLNRAVSVNADDEERLTTTLRVGYTHAFSEISSVELRISYGFSDGGTAGDDLRRTDLGATYRHRLTRDWSLNGGITYRVRDESGVGRSNSPSVFLALGRQFESGF